MTIQPNPDGLQSKIPANEVKFLYWQTDIPTNEICDAYHIPRIIDLLEIAGSWRHPILICGECKQPITVTSRTKRASLLTYRRGRLPPRVCKNCIESRQSQWGRELRTREIRLQILRAMPYREYLQTPEWRLRRNDALRRARFACQICSSQDRLQVHHRTYARRGQERNADIIVLCASCHTVFHETRDLAANGRGPL